MTGKRLFEELGQLDDKLVGESGERIYRNKKKRGKEGKWWRPAAAAAAFAIVFTSIGILIWYQGKDGNMEKHPAGTASKKTTGWEMSDQGSDVNQVQKVSYMKGMKAKKAPYPDDAYLKNLKPFYKNSIRNILTGEKGKNCTYSPVNLYLCIAMMTEMTQGETKEQLLDVLGQDEVENIRKQSRLIWESIYMDSPYSTGSCILGNSIWLNQDIMYQKDVLETLAKNYCTETYQGPMGTGMDKRVQSWVNDMTKNMLEEETGDIKTDPEMAFVLLSTSYFHDQWVTPFLEEDTKKDTFTNADGKKETCDFMNQTSYGSVYETERFQSIRLGFENDNTMVLYVPREGITVDELLEKDMEDILRLCAGNNDDYTYGELSLSLPKFNISSDLNLIPVMNKMGITDLFDVWKADFSELARAEDTGGDPVYVSKVRQASRVSVDENGCSVASFTEVDSRYGAAVPPPNHFEIRCDHPFLFIISNYEGIPVFAGVVNRMEE